MPSDQIKQMTSLQFNFPYFPLPNKYILFIQPPFITHLMPQFKSFAINQRTDQSKPQTQKRPYFKSQNQQNTHANPQFPSKSHNSQNSKQPTHNCLPIKDYKLRLKQNESFSGSKILKRKGSILSNIYRPKLQSTEEISVKNYLEIKNMNLIKENIKKLEINIPHAIPSLLNNSNRHKLRLSNSLKHQCKTERSLRQPSHRQPVFMFPNDPNQELFSKRRKLSHHFDRSKYFNCEPFLNKQQKDMSFRRQKTQYRINASIVREKKMLKEKIQQNRCLIDNVVPIIKQRTIKPKTAGGFLKKYRVQQVCLRPDFELHLTDEDIF